MSFKENYPVVRHARKYSYSSHKNADALEERPLTHHTNRQKVYENSAQIISQLQQKLAQEKNKYKRLQQSTIREQMNVLQQINLLDKRFNQVSQEKEQYKYQVRKLNQDLVQFKKIKGIASAMIDMRKKVQEKNGNLHDAWKWVKKTVREYQLIKKKALQWKQVYQGCTCNKQKKQQRHIYQNTFSDCSSSYDSNQ